MGDFFKTFQTCLAMVLAVVCNPKNCNEPCKMHSPLDLRRLSCLV